MTRPRFRLIALLRAKNESWIIDRFLERTSEFADAIIALDNGSTDGTVEALRGCKKVIELIEQPPGTPFQELESRNALLDAARRHGAEWVMYVDADEIMDARLAGELPSLLSDPAVGRIYFREVSLWRGTTHYRIDKPEKYGRDTATNQILRVTPGLRWGVASAMGIRARVKRAIKIKRWVPRPYTTLLTSVEGIEGSTVKASHLVRLHYHFVEWDRAWVGNMRYAVRQAIDLRTQPHEVDEIVRAFSHRMDEAGLELAPVRPEWGVL